MKSFRIYMILQWVLFLPIILPICIIYGALRGIVQMIELIIKQFMEDVAKPIQSNTPFEEPIF